MARKSSARRSTSEGIARALDSVKTKTTSGSAVRVSGTTNSNKANYTAALKEFNKTNKPSKPKQPKGPGGWKGVLQDVMESPVGKGLMLLDTPRAYITSQVADTAQEIMQGDLKGTLSSLVRPDWENKQNRTAFWAHTGAGTYLQQGIDAAGLDDTWVNNRALKIALGLAGDLALDPLSWMGGGVAGSSAKAGKTILDNAGRLAIAAGDDAIRAAGRGLDDVALAGIRETAETASRKNTEALASKVIRKGKSAMSRDESLTHFPQKSRFSNENATGLRLKIPGTGRGGKLLGYKGGQKSIPLLSKNLTNPITRTGGILKQALPNSELARKVSSAIGGKVPGVRELIRSGDPELMKQGFGMQTANHLGNAFEAAGIRMPKDSTIEGAVNAVGTSYAKGKQADMVFRDLSRRLKMKGNDWNAARDAVEGAVDATQLASVKGAPELKQFLGDLYRVLRDELGANVDELDNYFPRIVTDEARAAYGLPVGRGGGAGRPTFTYGRTVQNPEGVSNFTMRQFLDDIAKEDGLASGFYENDAVRTIHSYIRGLSRVGGQKKALQHLLENNIVLNGEQMWAVTSSIKKLNPIAKRIDKRVAEWVAEGVDAAEDVRKAHAQVQAAIDHLMAAENLSYDDALNKVLMDLDDLANSAPPPMAGGPDPMRPPPQGGGPTDPTTPPRPTQPTGPVPDPVPSAPVDPTGPRPTNPTRPPTSPVPPPVDPSGPIPASVVPDPTVAPPKATVYPDANALNATDGLAQSAQRRQDLINGTALDNGGKPLTDSYHNRGIIRAFLAQEFGLEEANAIIDDLYVYSAGRTASDLVTLSKNKNLRFGKSLQGNWTDTLKARVERLVEQMRLQGEHAGTSIEHADRYIAPSTFKSDAWTQVWDNRKLRDARIKDYPASLRKKAQRIIKGHLDGPDSALPNDIIEKLNQLHYDFYGTGPTPKRSAAEIAANKVETDVADILAQQTKNVQAEDSITVADDIIGDRPQPEGDYLNEGANGTDPVDIHDPDVMDDAFQYIDTRQEQELRNMMVAAGEWYNMEPAEQAALNRKIVRRYNDMLMEMDAADAANAVPESINTIPKPLPDESPRITIPRHENDWNGGQLSRSNEDLNWVSADGRWKVTEDPSGDGYNLFDNTYDPTYMQNYGSLDKLEKQINDTLEQEAKQAATAPEASVPGSEASMRAEVDDIDQQLADIYDNLTDAQIEKVDESDIWPRGRASDLVKRKRVLEAQLPEVVTPKRNWSGAFDSANAAPEPSVVPTPKATVAPSGTDPLSEYNASVKAAEDFKNSLRKQTLIDEKLIPVPGKKNVLRTADGTVEVVESTAKGTADTRYDLTFEGDTVRSISLREAEERTKRIIRDRAQKTFEATRPQILPEPTAETLQQTGRLVVEPDGPGARYKLMYYPEGATEGMLFKEDLSLKQALAEVDGELGGPKKVGTGKKFGGAKKVDWELKETAPGKFVAGKNDEFTVVQSGKWDGTEPKYDRDYQRVDGETVERPGREKGDPKYVLLRAKRKGSTGRTITFKGEEWSSITTSLTFEEAQQAIQDIVSLRAKSAWEKANPPATRAVASSPGYVRGDAQGIDNLARETTTVMPGDRVGTVERRMEGGGGGGGNVSGEGGGAAGGSGGPDPSVVAAQRAELEANLAMLEERHKAMQDMWVADPASKEAADASIKAGREQAAAQAELNSFNAEFKVDTPPIADAPVVPAPIADTVAPSTVPETTWRLRRSTGGDGKALWTTDDGKWSVRLGPSQWDNPEFNVYHTSSGRNVVNSFDSIDQAEASIKASAEFADANPLPDAPAAPSASGWYSSADDDSPWKLWEDIDDAGETVYNSTDGKWTVRADTDGEFGLYHDPSGGVKKGSMYFQAKFKTLDEAEAAIKRITGSADATPPIAPSAVPSFDNTSSLDIGVPQGSFNIPKYGIEVIESPGLRGGSVYEIRVNGVTQRSNRMWANAVNDVNKIIESSVPTPPVSSAITPPEPIAAGAGAGTPPPSGGGGAGAGTPPPPGGTTPPPPPPPRGRGGLGKPAPGAEWQGQAIPTAKYPRPAEAAQTKAMVKDIVNITKGHTAATIMAQEIATATAVEATSSAANIRRVLTAEPPALIQALQDEIARVKQVISSTPRGVAKPTNQIQEILQGGIDALQSREKLIALARKQSDKAIQASMIHEAEARLAEVYLEIAKIGKTQRAVRQVTNEANAKLTPELEDIAKRVHSGAWQELSSNPGLYAPRDVADMWKQMYTVTTPQGMKGFFSYYDKYVTWLKKWQIATPGFHVRNYLGGVFNNYLAGVDIGAVGKFYRTHRAWEKGLLGEAEGKRFSELMDFLGGGGQYSPDEIGGGVGHSWKPWATNFVPIELSAAGGHKVEFYLRGALGWDRILKGNTVEMAIDDIAKFHFDYSDLSQLERKIKRVVPFYTWTRYNVPLQLEMLLENPGKYTKYQIIKDNIEQNSEEKGVVPAFLKQDMFGVRLPFNFGGGQAYATPDLPFTQTISNALPDFKNFDPGKSKSYSSLANNWLSMMSPAVKTPIELLKGEQFFKGIPMPKDYRGQTMPLGMNNPAGRAAGEFFGGNNKTAYLLEQLVPAYGRGRRLFPSEEKYKNRRPAAIASFFGVPIRGVTKDDQRNEVLRRYFAGLNLKTGEKRR